MRFRIGVGVDGEGGRGAQMSDIKVDEVEGILGVYRGGVGEMTGSSVVGDPTIGSGLQLSSNGVGAKSACLRPVHVTGMVGL